MNEGNYFEENSQIEIDELDKPIEVVYDTTKDFYKGIRGELRFKAEGLFKKAKEKGISIENIEISTVKEDHIDIPGLGKIALPTYIVKVKGLILESQQVMIDGKQIDFYNRYQKYAADVIFEKNIVKDEHGKTIYLNKKQAIKPEPDLSLSDWEKFEIGKALIVDKEFGLEKTITGACDRVIRKLMGENDWLYPGEAKMLEEEFKEIDKNVTEKEAKKTEPVPARKASEKQISYFKSKLKLKGLNPEDNNTIQTIMEAAGFDNKKIDDLSILDMSRLIDGVDNLIPAVKKKLEKYIDIIQ